MRGDLRLTPDGSPVVDHHFLIIPRTHYLSMAALPLVTKIELKCLLSRLARALRRRGLRFSLYEHGNAIENPVRGASVDHAHIHVLGTPKPFRRLTDIEYTPASAADWLSQSAKSPYFFYLAGGSRRGSLGHGSEIPSQWIRMIAAESMRLPVWNWRGRITGREYRRSRSLRTLMTMLPGAGLRRRRSLRSPS